MFNKLSDGFRNAKLKLQGKTTLTEENIKYALKDVRMSLIEADVEIEVMRTFLQTVKERCLGDVVTLKTKGKQGKMQVSASDHFINICHDFCNCGAVNWVAMAFALSNAAWGSDSMAACASTPNMDRP